MLGARSHSHCCHPPKDTLVYSNARAYPLVPLCWFTQPPQVPSMTISIDDGVNPLQTTLLELGIVSGRVALLLRSAEIQPVFIRFSNRKAFAFHPFSSCRAVLLGGQMSARRSSGQVHERDLIGHLMLTPPPPPIPLQHSTRHGITMSSAHRRLATQLLPGGPVHLCPSHAANPGRHPANIVCLCVWRLACLGTTADVGVKGH